MSKLTLSLATLLAGSILGCQANHEPCTAPTTSPAKAMMDCPENKDIRGTQLGHGAHYRAQRQSDGSICLFATGQNSTAGWTNLLAVSMLRIYPPQYDFRQKAPEGMAAQVITDYSVCLKVRAFADANQDSVTVRDADGPHQVAVEPASN